MSLAWERFGMGSLLIESLPLRFLPGSDEVIVVLGQWVPRLSWYNHESCVIEISEINNQSQSGSEIALKWRCIILEGRGGIVHGIRASLRAKPGV